MDFTLIMSPKLNLTKMEVFGLERESLKEMTLIPKSDLGTVELID